MAKKKNILISLLLMLGLHLFGQEDSLSVQLDAFTLSFTKSHSGELGTKSESLDSLDRLELLGGDLSDWLNLSSSFYVRSYAAGGLTTPSFRGGSAQQTVVLWEGLPINSGMNGMVDLSLFPASFFDDVKVNFGGAGAKLGSGAMGGALVLEKDSIPPKAKIHLGLKAASFGDRSFWLNTSNRWTNTKLDTRFFNRSSTNDFTYWAPGLEKDTLRKLPNGAVNNYAIYSRLQHHLNKGKLRASIWYQNAARQVPPTYFETVSEARQLDKSFRSSLSYERNFGFHAILVQSRYQKTIVDYHNPIASVAAVNEANQADGVIKWSYQRDSSFWFSQRLLYQLQWVNADNYSEKVQDHRPIYVGSIGVRLKPYLAIQLDVRALHALGEFQTPSFDFSSDVTLNSRWKFQAKFSRVFRLPTLNDLYWEPGGNLDLRPEGGFAQELGLLYNLCQKHFAFAHQSTVYHKLIENWIAWYPNGAFWSAQNVKSVRSYGLETNTKGIYTKGKNQFGISLSTNYNVAEVNSSVLLNDASVGKQLIYTPLYKGVGRFFLQRKLASSSTVAINYRHSYTGYRYTSTDNQSYLKPFDLASLLLAWNIGIKDYQIGLTGSIHNIWSEEYELVASRPMPRTKYGLTLTFKYL